MKPIKNRIFCIGSNKQKMLFETQKNADNFLRFNSDEILEENGKAPVRSYYCTLCCGWHVTSNPSTIKGERLDERDRKRIDQVERFSDLSDRITENLLLFSIKLNLCEYEAAEDILTPLENELSKMMRNTFHDARKVSRVYEKIRIARGKLDKHVQLFNLPKAEQDILLEIPNPTKEELKTNAIINRQRSRKIVQEVFANGNNLIECEDTQMVIDIVEKCREYIKSSTTGNGAKQARELLNSKLNEIFAEHNKRRRKIQDN